ncbi:MAG: histidine phosphatase family protein [Chloroflexota bacterium]|nr:histidine phosphatase family protein [Chloroflexota bacterium]
MDRLTNLYLIRHGESILAREQHILNIMAEDRLTEEGIRQAERLRDRLAATEEIQADVLLASSLPRASQTAEIIAPALRLPVVLDDDLQEMRPGDTGGMYWDEYVEKHGRPDPVRQPFGRLTPTAESWGQFMLRVATTLHRIAHEHEGKTLVLVCHGGVVDGSLIGLLGLGTFYRPSFVLDTKNTAITHWQHYEKDGVPRWQLVKYNDFLHLQYNITANK